MGKTLLVFSAFRLGVCGWEPSNQRKGPVDVFLSFLLNALMKLRTRRFRPLGPQL